MYLPEVEMTRGYSVVIWRGFLSIQTATPSQQKDSVSSQSPTSTTPSPLQSPDATSNYEDDIDAEGDESGDGDMLLGLPENQQNMQTKSEDVISSTAGSVTMAAPTQSGQLLFSTGGKHIQDLVTVSGKIFN